MIRRRVWPRLRSGQLLTLAGLVALAVGAFVGWVLPRLAPGTAAGALVAESKADMGGYLGADITALAVVIAVVIGFNATILQIASQAHSLAVVRGMLLSLMPFLLCWSVTTGVVLFYFLQPPVYVAQLWQALIWFAAVMALMIGYLLGLPSRISGEYVASWAMRGLRGRPIERWESLEGYSVVQTAIASASARGDLGTLRALVVEVGRFLSGRDDPRAEEECVYKRERYRALKNLLSGCAQNATSGPHATAYHLGFVLAGVVVQAVAIGQFPDDPEREFYSGLTRALRSAPERLDPLWTGMRHALCRKGAHGEPYLLRYWAEHRGWAADDPRRAAHLAGALARLNADCRRQLLETETPDEAAEEAAGMLRDLYRDVAMYLGKEANTARRHKDRARQLAAAAAFLDATHMRALADWPEGVAEAHRARIVGAYEQRRAELAAL